MKIIVHSLDVALTACIFFYCVWLLTARRHKETVKGWLWDIYAIIMVVLACFWLILGMFAFWLLMWYIRIFPEKPSIDESAD